MFIPKKMNLNRFQVVELPDNRDIFGRIGQREPKPTPTELTDEDDEVFFQSRRVQNRMAMIDEAMNEYDRVMAEVERSKQAPPAEEEPEQ